MALKLQHAFAERLHGTEEQALKLFAAGQCDEISLASGLKLSETCMRYILNSLSEGGKITLTAKPHA